MNYNSIHVNDILVSLQALWSASRYAKTLQNRQYVLLSDELCELLSNSNDWTFYPYVKYACAQLLAGRIIKNNGNGKAIMVNTVEVYGRKGKWVDAHREPFGTKKTIRFTNMATAFCNTLSQRVAHDIEYQ